MALTRKMYLYDHKNNVRYLLTRNCEDVLKAPRTWQIEVASATRGKPMMPLRFVAPDGDDLLSLTRVKIDPHSSPRDWSQRLFNLQRDNNNTVIGIPTFVRVEMKLFLKEEGWELALDRIEDGLEPEIVALCGGMKEAIAVMDYWKHFIDANGYDEILAV
jgi:hypothetical protein